MPLIGSLKTLLLRGVLGGLVAGLLVARVGCFFCGTPGGAAIAIEEAAAAPAEHGHDAAEPQGHSHGDEDEPLVSRSGQKAGQFLALGLAGMAFGALFASAVNVARRFTTLSGPQLSLTTAVLAWAAIVAVPFFKYPANPPAVGDPDTINDRTWLWVAAVVLGLLAVAAAVAAYRVVAASDTLRLIAGVGAFVVVTTVGYVLLPGVNEVADDFPATLLWNFRVASLAETTTLWVSLGLAFAALTEFASRRSTPVVEQVPTAG
ncbi:CbtA family protein [Nocardia salmonicida]